MIVRRSFWKEVRSAAKMLGQMGVAVDVEAEERGGCEEDGFSGREGLVVVFVREDNGVRVGESMFHVGVNRVEGGPVFFICTCVFF